MFVTLSFGFMDQTRWWSSWIIWIVSTRTSIQQEDSDGYLSFLHTDIHQKSHISLDCKVYQKFIHTNLELNLPTTTHQKKKKWICCHTPYYAGSEIFVTKAVSMISHSFSRPLSYRMVTVTRRFDSLLFYLRQSLQPRRILPQSHSFPLFIWPSTSAGWCTGIKLRLMASGQGRYPVSFRLWKLTLEWRGWVSITFSANCQVCIGQMGIPIRSESRNMISTSVSSIWEAQL